MTAALTFVGRVADRLQASTLMDRLAALQLAVEIARLVPVAEFVAPDAGSAP